MFQALAAGGDGEVVLAAIGLDRGETDGVAQEGEGRTLILAVDLLQKHAADQLGEVADENLAAERTELAAGGVPDWFARAAAEGAVGQCHRLGRAPGRQFGQITNRSAVALAPLQRGGVTIKSTGSHVHQGAGGNVVALLVGDEQLIVGTQTHPGRRAKTARERCQPAVGLNPQGPALVAAGRGLFLLMHRLQLQRLARVQQVHGAGDIG